MRGIYINVKISGIKLEMPDIFMFTSDIRRDNNRSRATGGSRYDSASRQLRQTDSPVRARRPADKVPFPVCSLPKYAGRNRGLSYLSGNNRRYKSNPAFLLPAFSKKASTRPASVLHAGHRGQQGQSRSTT